MCPTPPTYLYEKVVNNTALPEALRSAAKEKLTRDKAFHTTINAVASTTSSEVPTKENDVFKCRIFSMGSSWPDKSMKYDGEDASESGPSVAKHTLPGVLVRDSAGFVVTGPDGKVLEDQAREQCYNGLRATHDLYKYFGRNSIDGQGKELVASIHIGIGYGNAYWAVDQMFFGDGASGRGITMPGAEIPDDLCSWFCSYDIDTIGHEITHGVVQESADLRGSAGRELEASTLNESIADCFGMMVKQRKNNLMVDESDWDISPGWWADSTVKAHGWTKNYCRTFRKAELADKEADFEPKHMDQWITTEDPHPNCGIPNHAFYLAALKFGGYAWESVGQIWYEALVDQSFKKPEHQTFRGFASLTCKQAQRLYGPKAQAILVQAWTKVGIFQIDDFGLQVGSTRYPTADQTSRRNCSTGQYHSVIIVSEDMLNAHLESYYHEVDALRKMNVENENLGIGIDAELAPSRIQIPSNAESLDRSKIIYHLMIKKARISYTEIPAHLFNPKKHKLSIAEVKDWDFAFQVNLGKSYEHSSQI